MILVCLLCTHSWHTFVRSPFACNTARGSIMQLLLLLSFAEQDFTSEVRRLKLFGLRCSELFRDSLIALYNSFT